MPTNSINTMLVNVYTAIFVLLSLTSTDADIMPSLQMKVISRILFSSGVATPGPTRAQALVKFVCALVKLFNSQA